MASRELIVKLADLQEVKDMLGATQAEIDRLRGLLELWQKAADRYREALVDLLDSLERGDGFMAQERMQTAGRLLGYARYDGVVAP